MAINYTPPVFGGGIPSAIKLTQAFSDIETALQDSLSLSGGTPNALENDLDLNGHELLNVGSMGGQVATLADVDAIVAIQLGYINDIETDLYGYVYSTLGDHQNSINGLAATINSIVAGGGGGGGAIIIDQFYNAASINAQSGTAVAEGIAAAINTAVPTFTKHTIPSSYFAYPESPTEAEALVYFNFVSAKPGDIGLYTPPKGANVVSPITYILHLIASDSIVIEGPTLPIYTHPQTLIASDVRDGFVWAEVDSGLEYTTWQYVDGGGILPYYTTPAGGGDDGILALELADGPVSPDAMLHRFLNCSWWLAPRDASYGWVNRGTGPYQAYLGGSTYFPGGEAVDFREIGCYTADSGLTIPDAPPEGTDWTIAVAFRWTNADAGNPTDEILNTGLLHVYLEGGSMKYTISGGAVQTLGSVVVNNDYLLIIEQELIVLINQTTNGTEVTAAISMPLTNPDTDWTVGGGNVSVLKLDGQLGDVVVDTNRNWMFEERRAASYAMAMRWRPQAASRRTYESATRGIVQAGLGLEGTARLDVIPDDFTQGAFVPVNVNSWGVSVDSSEVVGRGFGPPQDRTSGTFKVDAGAKGKTFFVSGAVEMRPVVASDIGCEVRLINDSGVNVTPYAAGGVTFYDGSVAIEPKKTVIAKAVGVNQWMFF